MRFKRKKYTTRGKLRFLCLLVLVIIAASIYHNVETVDDLIWCYSYLFLGGLIPLFLAAYFVYPALAKRERVNKIYIDLTKIEWEEEIKGQETEELHLVNILNKAAEQANNVFQQQFSVRNYIMPTAILFILSLSGNFVLFSYLHPLWGELELLNELILNIPTAIFYGFIGSNLFVLYSIITRFSSVDISPTMILGMSYQIILSTTAAYVLATLFLEQSDPAITFLVGFVPYADLATWFTNSARNKLGQKPLIEPDKEILKKKETENLYYLKGIAREDSLRLREEGIYTIQDLALSNPITLYLVTPFKMSQIIEWINQAYLHMFVGGQTMESFREMGVLGAMGVRIKVLDSLQTTTDTTAYENLVETVSTQTKKSKDVISSLMERLKMDPRVIILHRLWMEYGSE